MKRKLIRGVLGGLALAAVAVVVWRLGTSSMTSYRWSTHYARGETLIEEGSFSEAVHELEPALQAMRIIGPEHPKYDETRMLLADAYEAVGRYEEAYPLYMESMQRARQEHGKDSAEVATVLQEIARLHQLQGRPDAALGAYRQAIAVWQTAVGNEHPDLVPTLIGLGETLQGSGEYAEASQYLEWAIGLQRRILGTDNPKLAPLELRYADVLRKLGKDDLADQFAAHAESIQSQ